MSCSAVLADTPSGRYFRAQSEQLLCQVADQFPGLYGVQLDGWPLSRSVCERLALGHLFRLSPEPDNPGDLRAELGALPFESESVALVLAPCSLDGMAQPEMALEEIDRVLMPEGHIVLLAVNPWSPWAAIAPHPLPGAGRVMRYLDARGYAITVRRRYLYRPPMTDCAWFERLAFMDRMRLGPGGASLLVARKRIIGVPPVGVRLPSRISLTGGRERLPAGVAGGEMR